MDVYQTLEKYLTKKFAYRFIRNRKISSVIDNATEALNTAWEMFQVGALFRLYQSDITELSLTSVL